MKVRWVVTLGKDLLGQGRPHKEERVGGHGGPYNVVDGLHIAKPISSRLSGPCPPVRFRLLISGFSPEMPPGQKNQMDTIRPGCVMGMKLAFPGRSIV